MATLRAIASDPEFTSFRSIEEPYLSRKHVVVNLAWVEVFVEDGNVVNLAEDGTPAYDPWEQFVSADGALSKSLK